MGVGVGGDSTGTWAPALALASRQAGRPVGKGGRRAGSSVGLLMVAIFVSPS